MASLAGKRSIASGQAIVIFGAVGRRLCIDPEESARCNRICHRPLISLMRPSKSYRVNSGDRLRVTVFRHVDLSGEFVLDGGGFFALPLLGAINGAGRTPRELESDIETAFEDGGYLVNPQVGIEVLTYRPFYILGEVNQPGSYPYVSGMTAINAIAIAGGFTYRAKRSSMTISRSDNGPRRRIDATGEILPGDILTIHERFF